MFRIDDILAALLLALCMMRRLEVLAASHEENRHVSERQFEQWRELALSGYHLCAFACLGKVALSLGWLLAAPPQPWLQIGGLSIFVAWVVALVIAWRRTTEAGALRRDLRIETRRPKPSD